MTDDYELRVRAAHALLSALPRRVDGERTSVKVLRADDPEEHPAGDHAGFVSPLFVGDDGSPEVLIVLEREGVGCLFAVRQKGMVSPKIADVFPAAASPLDNPT